MTNSGAVHRAVIAFDISGRAPPGSRITTVTLSLNLSRTVSGPEKVHLHRLLADWGEGTSDAPANEGGGIAATPGDATWLHRFYFQETWKTAGGDFSEAASAESEVAGTGEYNWGSTPQMVADVQDWLDRPASNFGWLLRGNESKTQAAKRFDSSENDNEASRPMLKVEYLSSGRPTPTPTLPAAPTAVISQIPTPTPAPVSTLPPATSRQELAEIENYGASRFYPDRFVVLKGTPLRLYITRLHREHINRFTIDPFVRSTAFFPPGAMGSIEFTPDRAGEFRIRNEGHGYEAALVVVEGEAGLRDYWAGRKLQEFSLIHDFTGSQVAPQRLEVQQNIPVRIYSTGLGGQDKVSIPPFYMPTAVNVEQGKIAVFEFTPTVAGEFPIVYEQHNLAGALVVRGRP
jgi:hypothetical protein